MTGQQTQLPEGWEWKALGDVVKLKNGFAFKSTDFSSEGVPVIRISDLDGEAVSIKKSKKVPNELFNSDFQISKGDLLIAMSGATTGKVGIVKFDTPALQNQRVGNFKIVDSEKLIEGYRNYYVMYLRRKIEKAAYGGAQPNISAKLIESFKIPLPEASIQKQIVAKIEELFSHIDAGIESLEVAKQKLKQYRQSVLKAAVTGGLINLYFRENSYRQISECIESLGQGWSPRCEKEPASIDDWGVIKTSAVQSLKFVEGENKKLPSSLEHRPHLEVKDGDILITRAGPRKRLGVACLVRNSRGKLMICDKVYRLKVNTDIISPEFLEIVLNSPLIQDDLEMLKTGINDSGVNLTQTKFKKLQVPIPAIDEQKEIVRIVEEKLSSADRLMTEIDTKLTQTQQQKQTILASAFKGNLTKR